MKARYIGKTIELALTNNKVYECLGYESGFIRVIDDTGEDYLYEPNLFKIIEDYNEKPTN